MNRRSFLGSLFGAVVAAGMALRSEALFGKAVEVEGPADQLVPLELHIESIDMHRAIITFASPVVLDDDRIEELKAIYQRLRNDPTYLSHLVVRNNTSQTLPAGTPVYWRP